MSFVIEDGMGSTQKVSVFNNRVRTFANEVSLMNHISFEPNDITSHPEENPNVGVFTVRSFTFGTYFAGTKTIGISISNNDPINFMLIDRMYMQIVSSDATLPINGIILAIDKQIGTNPLPIINENKSIVNLPNVIARSSTPGAIGGSPDPTNVPRAFATVGNTFELISQESDAIILPGTGTKKDLATDRNTIGISLFVPLGLAPNIGTESFVRFIIADIDEFT